MISWRRSPVVLLSFPFLFAGCDDDDHHDVVTVYVTGVSASDFLTLSDYLNNSTVQVILDNMPRYVGSAPPNVDGSYGSSGTVTVSTIPGSGPGSAVTADFCFGPPSGSAIEAAVVDPTAQSADANSFIEGSGNSFTVYTAFKSVQAGPNGDTCEVHEVEIFSGIRNIDGSLSGLSIGFGIVGLVGDCGGLLVGDFQVSQNATGVPGISCVGGSTPADPAKVLVSVENFLVTDVAVYVTFGSSTTFIDIAPFLSSLSFEESPGFILSFESIPPLNDSAEEMGYVLAGEFSADTQAQGRFSFYGIGNQVGDEYYFAPIIQNLTSVPLTAGVNIGTSVEFDCNCSLAPDTLAQYILGYHPYDFIGVIAPAETNVLVDNPGTIPIDYTFQGPFTLGLDSGALSLIAD